MPTDPTARVRLLPSTLSLVLALGPVGLAGCGSSAEGICDEICDCEGCSDDEHEECVDDIEDSERAAENEGCADQFDELMSCIDDQLECRSGDIDADGCDGEDDDLDDCMEGSVSIGGGTNACDRAVQLCGGQPDPELDCSGANECAARCIVDANSCDIETSTELQQCVTGCQ